MSSPQRNTLSRHGVALFFAGCAAMQSAVIAAQEPREEFFALTAPIAGRSSVAKKPIVRVSFVVPVEPASVRVLLDGMDVSSLIELSGDGLSYAPREVLPGGDHLLAVQARTADGLDVSREFRFATRHSTSFTNLASNARLGLEVEGLAAQRDTRAPDPSYRMQGDMAYGLQATRGNWESGIETNLWYLNQKLPVGNPPREGLDLASYRLRAANRGERYGFSVDVGDVQVLGTDRTLGSLSRRGTQLGAQFGDAAFGAFAVNSQQVFGFRGGTGFGTDADRNVYGFTSGIGLFDDRLRFSAVHARGGEPGSSFGLFVAQGARRGRVTGYQMTARPVPSLQIEAEFDQSQLDENVADDIAAAEDEAYALRLSGQRRVFNYQVAYEHLGPRYGVIANSVQRDRENVLASGAIQLSKHSLSATALQQHDNVDSDPTRSRLTNREAALEYGFIANERWLFGAGYRSSQVGSSREPVGFGAQDIETSGFTGRAQYSSHPWHVAFEIATSDQDDRFLDANDSRVVSRSLTPAWQSPNLSIVPQFSTTTTTFRGSGSELVQRTLGLMLDGRLSNDRFGYGVTLVTSAQSTSDGLQDVDTGSVDLRLSYHLRRLHETRPRATFNLRSTHLSRRDHVFGTDVRDWTIWLTVSVNPQFSF
jgi:hypothetical protein